MGTAMKMASRSIDLVSKITNLHVQHTFFLVSKKTNLHVQHTFLFFFAVVLHDTMPFCTTKMSNFQVTHYFYGGIVVCAYQRFCFLCSCSLLFSCGCLFSPSCWALLAGCSLLATSISLFLTVTMNFSCFSSIKICLLCFQSLALALSQLSLRV